MTNPSTVWTQLASPLQADGSIPFVDTDNVSIITDVLHLWYDQELFTLYATNIAPAQIGGSLGSVLFPWGKLNLDYTITATVGAVTINKPSGRVIIALGAAAVIVTNSLVTANSIILVTIATADATLTFIKSVVAAAGSFTITGNANATANCKVNFLVINTDN